MVAPALTVGELFLVAGLSPCGPVSWSDRVPELGPGVYVATVGGNPARDRDGSFDVEKLNAAIASLPEEHRERWVEGTGCHLYWPNNILVAQAPWAVLSP